LSVLELPPNTAAPTWALGVTNAFSAGTEDANRANHFSLLDARRAMLYAATGKDAAGNLLTKAQRNAYWATMFRSLGDAAHLLEDMSQPQHTRNEAHPASAYEAYIDARARGIQRFRIDGAAVTELPPLNYLGYPSPSVDRYAALWSSGRDIPIQQRTGLADYSNRGFFTQRRNFNTPAYDLPSSDLKKYVLVPLTDPDYQRANIVVKFLDARVPDPVAGDSRPIHMTTQSSFAKFLSATPTYSLNRFNFDDQAELLIPRGVAYSTALLDYFFRGAIDCVKDLSVAYGCRLLNGGNEPLTGEFEIVYEADDGFLHPVPNKRSPDCTSLPPSDPRNPGDGCIVAFDEPTNPPAKVRGAYTVIFHGAMGQETADVGGVAVTKINLDSGALYVLAASSFDGSIVTLRTDAGGTRLLTGREADPFVGWAQTLRASFLPGRPYHAIAEPYHSKQVIFATPPSNEYKTISLRVQSRAGDDTYFAVADPGLDYETIHAFGWSAASPDRTLGNFRFFPSADFRSLAFKRTHWDSASSSWKTVDGMVPLPFPTNMPAFSVTVVYGDGLAIGESIAQEESLSATSTQCSVTTSSASTTRYYDMLISLSASPTVNFQELGSTNAQGSSVFNVANELCSKFESSNSSSTSTTRTALSIVSGVRQTMQANENSSGSSTGNDSQGTNTTVYAFADGSLTFSVTGQTTEDALGNVVTTNTGSGQAPRRPYLISRAGLQVVLDGATKTSSFEGVQIADEFARDVSPLGEIFFATKDGHTIIHRPLNNRMPIFRLPQGYDQILGAIWL
jgi:hypothetical protein